MSQDQAAVLVERARRFAALSGPFDPDALLDSLGDLSAEDAMRVTVDLSSVCDTIEAAGWLLRGSVRRAEIDKLSTGGDLDSAVEWRRRFTHDTATTDLLDALAGAGSFSPSAASAALERPNQRELLTRLVVALDRAGPHAPGHGHLGSLKAALGRLDARSRSQEVLSHGFLGREADVARAEEVLRHPTRQPPVPALYISGLPGIGKSTFIHEMMRRARSQSPSYIVIRLDFDRGGLDVQDLLGLTLEVCRQVVQELGASASELDSARIHAAGAGLTTQPSIKGQGRDHVPDELASVLGEVVRRSGHPVLMVLDTMEVLRGRGETHPVRLFEALDQLCRHGVRPLAVLAAGRGQALDGVPERVSDWIELSGLDGDSADLLLSRLDVEPTLFPSIREASGGVPLILRLCAGAVGEDGARAPGGAAGRRELASVYLYRFLVSRIEDAALRALARPGLIVRWINADLIAEVLAPQVGMRRMQPAEAVRVFEALATQHWLVEPDEAVPGWVRLRTEVRRVLLKNMYLAERASRTARLNRAAARWFEGRPEPFAQLEAAYHHLQAMRSGDDAPDLARDLLYQFDDETLAELPGVAQDVVRITRGDRTSSFRGGRQPSATLDLAGAARELEATLERGDLREAEYVYDRSFGRVDADPTSPAAHVARSFLWRAGRWTEALRGFDPRRSFVKGLPLSSPTVALAELEMWAESRFVHLVKALTTRPELVDLATDLRLRELKGSLANGALGFALVAAGAWPRRTRSSTSDPVATAVRLWTAGARGERGSHASSAQEALARQSMQFASRVSGSPGVMRETPTLARLPDLRSPAGAARILASATPYATVATALIHLDRGTRLREHVSRIEHHLCLAGAMPPAGAGDWHLQPAGSAEASVETLSAVGLLAEWMGVSSFVLHHPDLRQIAGSAERWRRTGAGDWAYTPRPHAPTWSLRPDATLRDRIAQLGTRQECLEQVATWAGMADRVEAEELVARLRRRYRAADRESRNLPREGAAAVLVQHRVPSAFIPPLAVLNSSEGERP